jgi:SAM-dependent methyltransferase
MGDYTNMSAYYDVIMTSGYYDYGQIVDDLARHGPFENILEIGCGTGLILEEFGRRNTTARITGIDLTEAMLKQARKRLDKFPSITLACQNVVELSLDETYDAAFSYGGVWYFVIDGEKEPFMVSHIRHDAPNRTGLEKLAARISSGGMLLLGIQGPHFDYEKPISNGMTYAQEISPHDCGFTKDYYLIDEGRKVMAQTIDYRIYSWTQTLEMLGALGFTFLPQSGDAGKFLAFRKA